MVIVRVRHSEPTLSRGVFNIAPIEGHARNQRSRKFHPLRTGSNNKLISSEIV